MIIIHYLSLAIGIAGITVITWGSVISFLQVVKLEIRGLQRENVCRKREHIRHYLGTYILMGLEFLIAADLIRTVIRPTLQELAVLGSIVAIRTVISYFLNKEME
ncbi:MAG: DUF1622 domain-containing protein [Candidatus Tantalella remota]|nr:DUF1622 domain-containing protein [Candidatus Tantalella remota]